MEGEKNQLDRKKTKDAWKHTKTKNKQRKTHARTRARTHTHTRQDNTHMEKHTNTSRTGWPEKRPKGRPCI